MPVRKSRAMTTAKTVRFPDDIIAYVEQFHGDNFSEKLLCLIERYQRELPERLEKLEQLEIEIRERCAQYDELDRRFQQMDEVLFDALEIQPTFQHIRAEVLAILESLPDEPKPPGTLQRC